MARFKKKPVVIDAFQWTGGPNQTEDPIWAIEAIRNGSMRIVNPGTSRVALMIETLEGPIRASQDDWIIRGIKGELYPCKPDIFEITYERVEN